MGAEEFNRYVELTGCDVVYTEFECPFCNDFLYVVYPKHSDDLPENQTPCGKDEHCYYICADCKFVGHKNNLLAEILLRNDAINKQEGRTTDIT